MRRGQQRDVLDRILDVEVFQRRDVEVRRMEVGLDQARHDRAAAGVDALRVGGDARRAGGRAGVGDAAVLDDERRVGDRRRAGAVDQLAVGDERGSRGEFHGREPFEKCVDGVNQVLRPCHVHGMPATAKFYQRDVARRRREARTSSSTSIPPAASSA